MAVRELYLTIASEGARVLRDGVTPLRGMRRVTFYVHGYNVDAAEARVSFDQLIAAVRKRARIPLDSTVPHLDGAEAWRIYWPAYARVGMRRSTLSFASYRWHVVDVDKWAEVLAEYLRTEFEGYQDNPVEVTFVGHSLGCRLILETLRNKLVDRCSSWTVRNILLMAAAVPVALVDYEKRLFRSVLAARRRCVAYSPFDLVLQLPFRAGQAGEGGLMPTAVGTFGQPSALWTHRLRTLNGHSGYFNDPRTIRFVAATLRVRIPRQLDERPLVAKRLATRALMKSGQRPSRVLRGRRIGS